MSDHIACNDLNEDPNELKEKIVTREDIWIIPDRYYIDLDLNPTQALLLTILRQTGKKKGYSEVSYSYIRKYTKQKDIRTIANDLKLLEEKKQVYIHRYTSKTGKRRKYVTQDNSGKYWSYLSNIKQYGERKKFEEEFMLKVPIPTDPDKNTTPASAKNAHGPSAKNAHAINTTYLSNRINDVTCKSPDGPAASSEASSAASSSRLKEELEQTYPASEVAIGMQWYEMKTDAKRATMKKPIACIVKALQDGYAHEEVSSKNAEVTAKLSHERGKKFIRDKAKKEMSSNEKLSHQLVSQFSQLKGWRHSLDSKGFTVYNDATEKCKDPDTNATYYVMPNGDHHWGTLGLRVNFDMPHQEFKHSLKKYFAMSEWSSHTQLEKMKA